MVHHVYEGKRVGQNGIAIVDCDGYPFDHRESLLVANHSPTGFEWGYGGSGPAQLALALLLEVTDEETAMELHQAYKWDVIAQLDRNHWRISTNMIVCWLWLHLPQPQADRELWRE